MWGGLAQRVQPEVAGPMAGSGVTRRRWEAGRNGGLRYANPPYTLQIFQSDVFCPAAGVTQVSIGE